MKVAIHHSVAVFQRDVECWLFQYAFVAAVLVQALALVIDDEGYNRGYYNISECLCRVK